MKHKFHSVLAAAAVVLATHSTPASAVVSWIFSSGELTGAQGVVVSGNTYNVQFMDTNCNTAFAGACTGASPFTFTTEAQALAASQALLNQVLVNISGHLLGTNADLVSGCENILTVNLCYIHTPYRVNGLNGLDVVTADRYLTNTACDGTLLLGFNTQSLATQTLAVWTPVNTVPEPSGWALMGLGLATLGTRLGQRRARAQAA